MVSIWRNVFFAYNGDIPYALDEQVYLLAKRLHQQYSEIMKMPRDTRMYLINRELEVIEEENKAAKGVK